MFMVFLAMIINAGLLTRDRMKLQNTADLAALVGGNVQRFNLNTIGDLNDAIETAYIATQALLANPITSSPCAMQFKTCSSAGGSCQVYCKGADREFASAVAATYSATQAFYMNQIMSIVQHANGKAYEYAKKTALAAPNMPIDIKRQLLKASGGNLPGVEQMVKEYDRGSLQYDYAMDGQVESLRDIYKISANDQQPLFIPDVEIMILLTFMWDYNPACEGILASGGDGPCYIGSPGGIEIPKIVAYRIKDTGDLTPSFITAVSYSPQYLFNFIPVRAMPNPENPLAPGDLFTAPGSTESVKLFDSLMGKVPFTTNPNARQFMVAWAASRPYGGSPAKGGYDGSKMIGLASKSVGEIAHALGISVPIGGNGEGEHNLTEKDFLH
jgi:hypothetical protein